MPAEPDYSTYPLEELLDARRTIDGVRHPTRLAGLEAEIILRRREPSTTAPSGWKPDLTTRGVAAYLVGSGALSLIWFFDQGMLRDFTVMPWWSTAIALAYGIMVLAGVALLRRWRVRLWLGVIAMSLHIPMIQYGSIAYVISGVPTFHLQVLPSLGIFWTWEPALLISWRDKPQSTFFALNLIAAAFTIVLAERLLRRQEALERLRSRPMESRETSETGTQEELALPPAEEDAGDAADQRAGEEGPE